MKEDERKRTDMELWFDGRSVAVDYTVPNTLNLKQRTPGLKYAPLEVRTAAQNLKNSKYANFARNKNHEFVPLVAESLGGLGGMAVKLFGEIARAQASIIKTPCRAYLEASNRHQPVNTEQRSTV